MLLRQAAGRALRGCWATATRASSGGGRACWPSAAAGRSPAPAAAFSALARRAAHRPPASTSAPFSSWVRAAGLRHQGGGRGPGGFTGRSVDPDTALYGLIAANVAVYGAWTASAGRPRLRDGLSTHATVSPARVTSRPWTLLTSAFSHKDASHLLVNMVTLFFFGRSVARSYGGARLLKLYAAAAVAGSAAHCAAARVSCARRYGDSPPAIKAACVNLAPSALGASGAVNGILALSILAAPRATVLVYGVLPVPAALLGALYVAQDLRGAARESGGRGGGSGIAHWGHLGGAAVGAAVWAVRVRTGRWGWGGW